MIVLGPSSNGTVFGSRRLLRQGTSTVLDCFSVLSHFLWNTNNAASGVVKNAVFQPVENVNLSVSAVPPAPACANGGGTCEPWGLYLNDVVIET
ncbi:hypothetical protein EVAR_5081_1 [Eumeta japonica]|uniref:Uncharacterized protein n=1 Tax=Eumeta variegata TaxID=151549 RepID=A0A4C1SWV5_EUMVA|nr:hypothetical protein EVAR_5081_1 [Eumeta japonica]